MSVKIGKILITYFVVMFAIDLYVGPMYGGWSTVLKWSSENVLWWIPRPEEFATAVYVGSLLVGLLLLDQDTRSTRDKDKMTKSKQS